MPRRPRPGHRSSLALASMISFILAMGAAFAQDCQWYQETIHRTDVIDTGDVPRAPIVIVGHHLFVEADHQFHVYSITDPWSVQFVTALDGVGQVEHLGRTGSFLCAHGSQGLQVIDVTDPLAPTIRGQLAIPATDLDVMGNLVVLASGGNLVTVDISDPDLPVVRGELTGLEVFRLVVAGEMVYGTDGYETLLTCDVSDPSAPVLAQEITGVPFFLYDVAIANGCLYGISFGSDYPDASLLIYDLADPQLPVFAGSISREASSSSGDWRLESNDERLFLSANSGWEIIDVADPFDPAFANHVFASSDRGIGFGPGEFVIYDNELSLFSDPRFDVQPVVTHDLPFGGRTGIAVLDGCVCIAGTGGVHIVGMAEPGAPVDLGTIAPGTVVRGVASRGNVLFVSSNDAIGVYDLTVPESPVALTDIAGTYSILSIGGDYLAARSNAGLEVHDISDPARPMLVGANPAITATEFAWSGDHLLCLGGPTLWIVDSQDPNLVVVGKLNIPGIQIGALIETIDHYAVVTSAIAGLLTVDIQDLTEPVLVNEYPVLAGASLSLDGTIAYAGYANVAGVSIFDLSDPTQPVGVGGLLSPLGTSTGAVDLSATYGEHLLFTTGLVLAVAPRQCTIVSVSDQLPHHPPTATAPRLVSISPNPFNPRTTLTLEIPTRSRVELSIHDLRGRHVRTLLDGDVSSGRHELTWDGRDFAGRPVASGVYIARLAGRGQVHEARMTLVR